jgi:hypothetical protein
MPFIPLALYRIAVETIILVVLSGVVWGLAAMLL